MRTWLIAVTAAVLVGSQVRAEGLERTTAATKEAPTVTQRTVDGVCYIDAHFALPASIPAAWKVLSDSKKMGEFVSHMRRGAIKTIRPEPTGQEPQDEAFFVSKEFNVLLDVREKPMRSIEFKDIANKDFEIYRGSWKLKASGKVLKIRYHLEAKPRLKPSTATTEEAFRANAILLVNEVRAEIMRGGHDRTGKL